MSKVIAEIDLSIYRYNIQQIRKQLPPSVAIMAVVKANAYGHGAVKIVQAAQKEGVAYVAVARFSEALELRVFGIDVPILLLSELEGENLLNSINIELTHTIYNLEYAQKLNSIAQKLQKKVKVHIKVDTGMHRLGVLIPDAISFCKKIALLSNLVIEGIYTHFSDCQLEYTNQQYDGFLKVLAQLEKNKIQIPLKHAANSYATLNYSHAHFNMVRLGLATYENILTLKGYVSQVKHLPKNAPISYSRTYHMPNAGYIAVVGAGYADGLPLRLSNQGQVLIKGRSYPIIGRVCMDLLMVYLGKNKAQIEQDEEVVFLGQQDNHKITMEDICKITGQIPYEVMCGINPRVERLYKDVIK